MRLAEYVSAFHPRLIGLTGSSEQIRSVALAYKANYAKVKDQRGKDYAIDHTGVMYLSHGDVRQGSLGVVGVIDKCRC